MISCEIGIIVLKALTNFKLNFVGRLAIELASRHYMSNILKIN